MDDDALVTMQAELVEWGLVELTPSGPALTRRFRGALARAAMLLREEEKAGRRPEGHPVARAIETALAGWELPAGASARRDHARFLTAIEIASLPEQVLALLEPPGPAKP